MKREWERKARTKLGDAALFRLCVNRLHQTQRKSDAGSKVNSRQPLGMPKVETMSNQKQSPCWLVPCDGHKRFYICICIYFHILHGKNQRHQFPGELYNVEAIEVDRIRVDRVWNKEDIKPVLLYKMVLSQRHKLLLR